MHAGKLDRRVQYQTATEEADAFGQMQPTWAAVGTYWASVEAVSGRESRLAEQMQAVVTHTIRIRYQGDTAPAPGGRFVEGSRVFHIESALDGAGRNREWVCLCRELAAGA